jgi:O-antigen/teichoic acid export membrane protein
MYRNLFSFKKYFKEGFWIAFGQIFGIIATLIGVRFLTEILSTNEFGVLSLSMTCVTLLNQLLFGPLSNGILRFYSIAYEKNQLLQYFTSIKKILKNITLLILLLSFLIILILVLIKKNEWILIVIFSLLFSLFSGFDTIFTNIQNAARERKTSSLFTATGTFLKYFFAIIFICVLKPTSNFVLLGYSFALVLILLIEYHYIYKLIQKFLISSQDTTDWTKEIILYSWPFSSWGIFSWLQSSSDRWALSYTNNTQDVGLYSASYQISYGPINLLTGFIMQFLTPIFFQMIGDANDPNRNHRVSKLNFKITYYAIGFTLLLFFITIISHNFFFKILLSSKFETISYTMPWLVLASGLFATGQNLSLSMMSLNKTQSLIPVKITTALIGLIFNYFGARFYGINGIIFSNVFFSIVYLTWIYFLTLKYFNKTNNIEHDKPNI